MCKKRKQKLSNRKVAMKSTAFNLRNCKKSKKKFCYIAFLTYTWDVSTLGSLFDRFIQFLCERKQKFGGARPRRRSRCKVNQPLYSPVLDITATIHKTCRAVIKARHYFSSWSGADRQRTPAARCGAVQLEMHACAILGEIFISPFATKGSYL